MKYYKVTIRKQDALPDEQSEAVYELEGKSAAHAIRSARICANGDGFIGKGQGRYTATAKPATLTPA